MKLLPTELPDNGYRPYETLTFEELPNWLKAQLKKKTAASRWFLALNVLFSLFFFGLASYHYHTELFQLRKLISFFFLGFAASFLLIPIHEYLHVFAYRQFGCTSTRISVDWKRFMFLAEAHLFVVNYQEFRKVALAPFVVISSGLLLVSFFVSPAMQLLLLSTNLVHASFCAGDFGLISYFQSVGTKELVTFDDSEKRQTEFWIKEVDSVMGQSPANMRPTESND